MGVVTDQRIADWQQHAGIVPASGERANVLVALSKAAYEAIQIIELERSGIRDGDGYWHGSDVIGMMTSQLAGIMFRLKQIDDKAHPVPVTAEDQAFVDAALARPEHDARPANGAVYRVTLSCQNFSRDGLIESKDVRDFLDMDEATSAYEKVIEQDVGPVRFEYLPDGDADRAKLIEAWDAGGRQPGDPAFDYCPPVDVPF
jgi:hypothetical protein